MNIVENQDVIGLSPMSPKYEIVGRTEADGHLILTLRLHGYGASHKPIDGHLDIDLNRTSIDSDDAPMMLTLEPTAPHHGFLGKLHRKHDGWVTVCRKDGAKFEQIAALRANELDPKLYLPGIYEWLTRDSYFTIHGQARPGRGKSKRCPELHAGHRSNDSTRWLTSCFVDLDFRDGSNKHAMMARAHALVAAGVIPEWSYAVFSGQGMWLMWLLHSVDGEYGQYPVRAHESRKIEWKRTQAKLNEACKIIHADGNARDFARVMRIPGSTNSKSGVSVSYSTNFDERGRVVSYTMQQMAAFMRVRHIESSRERPKRFVSPELAAQRRRARAKMLDERNAKIELLIDARGGTIPEGRRDAFVFVMGTTYFSQDRKDRPTVTRRLHDFNERRCSPPLERTEVDSIVNWLYQRHVHNKQIDNHNQRFARLTNDEIRRRLAMTDSEAAAVGWTRTADRTTRGNRTLAKRHRQEQLRQILAKDSGELKPAPYYVTELARRGLTVQERTVRRDLAELVGVTPAELQAAS